MHHHWAWRSIQTPKSLNFRNTNSWNKNSGNSGRIIPGKNPLSVSASFLVFLPRFRGLRFLGDLSRSLMGLRFRGLCFLGGLRFLRGLQSSLSRQPCFARCTICSPKIWVKGDLCWCHCLHFCSFAYSLQKEINWLFLRNIQGEIVFQLLQNLWVAKVLMSSYNLCKMLRF